MKCFGESDKAWEAHVNDLNGWNTFIDGYEQESTSCDVPIVHHMNTLTQAWAKHLTEEGGLLGGMLKKIKP